MAGGIGSRWVALVFVVVCCGPLSALNPAFEVSQYAHASWTSREGFLKGEIDAIAQTPDGYLWLGTQFGLVRFDGVRAVPWTPPAGQQLPSGEVHSLLVSRDGRLWIGAQNSLASLRNGKLTQYPRLSGQDVIALLEDPQGTVWVGTLGIPSGELCAIQNETVHCLGQDGRFGLGVYSLYLHQGSLWAGAMTGLWRWKPKPALYPVPNATGDRISLVEGDDGALWIATRGGISELVNGASRPLPASGRLAPYCFLRDRDHGLWIGTADKGVAHLMQGRIDIFGSAAGLSGDRVNAIFEDREGNLWVATTGGLDRFRDFSVHTISVKQGLPGSLPSAVLASKDGSIWLGSGSGLFRLRDGRITVFDQRSGLVDSRMESIFQDDAGRIWVSTPHGLSYFENERFVRVDAVATRMVHNIVEEQAGRFWINEQYQGLLHLVDGRLAETFPWSRLGHKDPGLSVVVDTARGGLWIGFYRGGVVYFKDGKVRATYSAADGLGEGEVRSLHLDSAGALWAATAGGLSRIQNGHIATLSSRNGLPCDSVFWTIEDNDRSTWLFTPCGLVRIASSELQAWVSDPRRLVKTNVLDTSDGVRISANASHYSPNVAKSPDGKLWFVTLDGVAVLDPRHLAVNNLPPPVQIEQIKADRKLYDAANGLRLPPRVRDVWIDYTALSFAAPAKMHFRYKLEGQDQDWIEVVNAREAQYSNLAPRHYRFRVAASNNSGVWNETGASLDFSIAPAYYQTAWFRASCVGAFLALLWALYRLRLHQIAREFNARLDERVAERTRIARELHDTLLQSFHGLMFRFQAARNLVPRRPEDAVRALDEALERTEQALAEGRDAIQGLRTSAAGANDLAQAVTALGDELACGSARFHVVVQGQARDLHPILRDEIYAIAREAVRNAFRHAQARDIEAEITYHESSFQLRVRDDGKGFDRRIVAEGRAGHFGVPGMHERAKRIGGKLDVWTGSGAGTEVELNIPASIAYETSPGRPVFGLFRKKAANS